MVKGPFLHRLLFSLQRTGPRLTRLPGLMESGCHRWKSSPTPLPVAACGWAHSSPSKPTSQQPHLAAKSPLPSSRPPAPQTQVRGELSSYCKNVKINFPILADWPFLKLKKKISLINVITLVFTAIYSGGPSNMLAGSSGYGQDPISGFPSSETSTRPGTSGRNRSRSGTQGSRQEEDSQRVGSAVLSTTPDLVDLLSDPPELRGLDLKSVHTSPLPMPTVQMEEGRDGMESGPASLDPGWQLF